MISAEPTPRSTGHLAAVVLDDPSCYGEAEPGTGDGFGGAATLEGLCRPRRIERGFPGGIPDRYHGVAGLPPQGDGGVRFRRGELQCVVQQVVRQAGNVVGNAHSGQAFGEMRLQGNSLCLKRGLVPPYRFLENLRIAQWSRWTLVQFESRKPENPVDKDVHAPDFLAHGAKQREGPPGQLFLQNLSGDVDSGQRVAQFVRYVGGHLLADPDQALDRFRHLVEILRHIADFIPGFHLGAVRQVAGGEPLHISAQFAERLGHDPRKGNGQQAQRRGQGEQRDGVLVVHQGKPAFPRWSHVQARHEIVSPGNLSFLGGGGHGGNADAHGLDIPEFSRLTIGPGPLPAIGAPMGQSPWGALFWSIGPFARQSCRAASFPTLPSISIRGAGERAADFGEEFHLVGIIQPLLWNTSCFY